MAIPEQNCNHWGLSTFLGDLTFMGISWAPYHGAWLSRWLQHFLAQRKIIAGFPDSASSITLLGFGLFPVTPQVSPV